jgi:hypothetical protein
MRLFLLSAVIICGLSAATRASTAIAAAGDPPSLSPVAEGELPQERLAPSEVAIGTAKTPGQPPKITDQKHPDFVRCRSEQVLGSRASRVRVCRTNREWEQAARAGNRETQEFMNIGRPTQPSP